MKVTLYHKTHYKDVGEVVANGFEFTKIVNDLLFVKMECETQIVENEPFYDFKLNCLVCDKTIPLQYISTEQRRLWKEQNNQKLIRGILRNLILSLITVFAIWLLQFLSKRWYFELLLFAISIPFLISLYRFIDSLPSSDFDPIVFQNSGDVDHEVGFE